nr:Uncharacterised protein [Klebsiella pneumoniae]
MGGQQFIFREGAANQLTELVFRVANPALKGSAFVSATACIALHKG